MLRGVTQTTGWGRRTVRRSRRRCPTSSSRSAPRRQQDVLGRRRAHGPARRWCCGRPRPAAASRPSAPTGAPPGWPGSASGATSSPPTSARRCAPAWRRSSWRASSSARASTPAQPYLLGPVAAVVLGGHVALGRTGERDVDLGRGLLRHPAQPDAAGARAQRPPSSSSSSAARSSSAWSISGDRIAGIIGRSCSARGSERFWGEEAPVTSAVTPRQASTDRRGSTQAAARSRHAGEASVLLVALALMLRRDGVLRRRLR